MNPFCNNPKAAHLVRWVPPALLLSTIGSALSAQSTWYVDGSGCNGAGTGMETDPFCTIQEAVDVAASGDTVRVKPGLYLEEVLVPAMQLTILGVGGAELTEIRGEASYLAAVELAAGGVLQLEGLSLSGYGGGLSCAQATAKVARCRFIDSIGVRHNGGYPSSGGGVWAERSDVTVSLSDFENTLATQGGAIAAVQGTLQVEDCRFPGEFQYKSSRGGALWLENVRTTVTRSEFSGLGVVDEGSAIWVNGGQLVLTCSTFEGNYVVQYGGTVVVLDADAHVSQCTFRDNISAYGWGGALYAAVGPVHDVEILGCSFDCNAAAEGGAICIRRGFASLQHCTFSKNEAWTHAYYERGHGGALFVGGFPWEPPGVAFATASRCVFVGNVARGHSYLNAGRGGGVFGPVDLLNCTFYRNAVRANAAPDEPTGGAVAGGATLANCIAWANSPDQLEEPTEATWSDIQQGWSGTGNLGLDPRFWSPEAGDLHLLPSSPCIDAGDPALLDADGSRLDIGAHAFDLRHAYLGRRGRGAPGG